MHTAGPWHVVEYGDGDQLVVCSDEQGEWRICFMATHGGSRSSWERIQDDAKLIALAPAMHEYIKSSADNGCATAKHLLSKLSQ